MTRRRRIRCGVAVDTAHLRAWCRLHLGCDIDRVLFRAGYFSEVVGVALRDGSAVVVKVRAAAPRLHACFAVHDHLHRHGLPCPAPVLGPTPFSPGRVATVEQHVEPQGGVGTSAASAALLARLVDLAPNSVPVLLSPPPAWVHWRHNEAGTWPRPDDDEVDLNGRRIGWIDDLGRDARALLRAIDMPPVVGHADWIPQNVWWTGVGAPHVVHDWDSVVVLPEPALAGVGAALHRTAATVAASHAFLTAYAGIRRWDDHDHRIAWAAGLWTLLFDAKKDLLAGRQPSLHERDARERHRLALPT